MLIESYAGLAVQVDDYNTHVLLGEKIDTVAYCQTISTLVRVASRLGLSRRARDVSSPTLSDILAERSGDQTDEG